MKSYLIKGMLTACLFYPLLSDAQSEIDALRYSQSTFGSTARSLAMGGAFGALGADYSSMSSNPAGIGVYRKSEFTFSMGFNNRNTESEFLGNQVSTNRFSFDIPDIGMVFAFTKPRSKSWKQFGFGLGYHRTANFNSEINYGGKNTDNSLLDDFVEDIRQNGGATPEDLFYYYPFDADLAYQTYLLNPDPLNNNQYITVIPDGGAFQSQNISTHGGMGEFSLGFGGNYNEKLFIGFTLGFPTIRYEEESTYEERDPDQEISVSDTLNFRSFRYNRYLYTRGNGFNAKFGMIVKPAEWLRIGAAIHTPTYFYMHDEYHSAMSSNFEDGSSYQYLSPNGGYAYRLTTPFKAVGSLAFIFGKSGILSIDYEMTSYTMANLDASDYNFSSENKLINSVYNSFSSNLRAGVELKHNNFAFRGGAAYYSAPIKSEYSSTDTDQHVISFTGGIGYRQKRFFVDVGYGYFVRGESFTAYTLATEHVPAATFNKTDNKVVTTFGLRF